MIVLYSGTPGSGKSYDATCEIVKWLRRGKPVIANYDVNLSSVKKGKCFGKFTYWNNQELTPEVLIQYSEDYLKVGKENQCLLVIDECASIFNCRSWEAKNRNRWVSFFQVHRHYGYYIILVSQADRLIDRQIRYFIETEYKHRSIKNYKLFGKLLSLLVGGLFVKVEYWYGVREKCGSEFIRFSKRKARAYDSYIR